MLNDVQTGGDVQGLGREKRTQTHLHRSARSRKTTNQQVFQHTQQSEVYSVFMKGISSVAVSEFHKLQNGLVCFFTPHTQLISACAHRPRV